MEDFLSFCLLHFIILHRLEFSVGREPHACSEGGGCFGLCKSTIDIIKKDVILVAVGAGKSLSAAG